jgi:hypothetical protein
MAHASEVSEESRARQESKQSRGGIPVMTYTRLRKHHWPQTTLTSLAPFENFKGHVMAEQTASHHYLCDLHEVIHELKI